MRRKLTYANVMATLAFFFALTGGAMATTHYLAASDTIAASSDLAGSTYGNPLIAAGKVTTGKIADGAITSAKFASSAKAPDADTLDGVDSTAFVSNTQTVENSDYSIDAGATTAFAHVSCPAGKHALGGGVEGEYDSVPGTSGEGPAPVSFSGQINGPNGWDGEIMKPGGGALSGFDALYIHVYAVCASGS